MENSKDNFPFDKKGDCKMPVDKYTRILLINDLLQSGKSVRAEELAEMFHTSKRTIIRDIRDLRDYYADCICFGWCSTYQLIEYDREKNTYQLTIIVQ